MECYLRQVPLVKLIQEDVSNKTILISKKLEKKGIYIVPIRPPSVPSNTSRLRISISSNHSQNDIKKLFNLLKNLKI